MLLPRRTAVRFLVAILLLSTFSPASAFADKSFSLDTARNNLTYVVSQLASFFSDLADAIASHIPVTSLTASAAAPSPTAPPAPAPDFLATTTPEASTPPITTTASDALQTTIIQQPVIERIVEHTVPAPSASGISEQTLAGRLASLKDDLLLRIAAVASAPIVFSGPAPTTPVSTATFAPSQRIDQLTNTAINTPTITGGSISGASVSGYLPLSGGTLTGTLSGTDLTLSGALTAGALNVSSIASAGALIGPYFTATSTTATSTFAGAVSVSVPSQTNRTTGYQITGSDGNGFVISNFGNSSNLFVGNVVGTNATGSIGYYNTIFGLNSGANIVSAPNGYANSFFGHSAGRDTSSGYGNTFIGNNAGLLNSTGLNNIVLGVNAGNNLTTGSNNIIIGANASAPSATGDSQLNIGNTLYGNLALGNVGIGTTTPWGKLSITGSGTGTSLAFAVADSANTPRLVIQDNGNVGIGTTTPSAKLEVADGAGNSIQSTGKHLRHRYGSDPADTYRFFLTSNTLGDFGMGIGNEAGLLLRSGDGTQRSVIASQENDLAFFTGGSTNANATERLRITSAGNVGIGTTSPQQKLHVGNANDMSTLIRLDAQQAATAHGILLDGSAGNTQWFIGKGSGRPTTNGIGFKDEDLGRFPFWIEDGVPDGAFRIANNGNVGIGTTTPWGKLSITGSGTGTGLAFAVADSANTPRFVIQDNGNVGIGTTGPGGKLDVAGPTFLGEIASGNNGRTYVDNNGGARLFQYDNSGAIVNFFHSNGNNYINGGNVGIGTTTPTAQLSTTGTVRFAGLGSAGANLVTDALGNVTASSDERLKDKQGDFTRGLAAINAISPVLYKWRPETGFDTQSTYAGFFAQNVQAAIPEAVSQDSRGNLTLADRPILAALVNATKEIGTIAGAFKSSLIVWLGSASNGIGDLFAKDIYATNGTFDTTSTRKLCIIDGANDNAPLCLTKSQLAALLGQSAAANLPPSVIPTTATNSPESVLPPVIELNGNASSTIEVGDSYNDLGARITGPQSDINLGIVIVLDGATTTAVSIDTTTPGEHTILYTVTSPTSGLTGTTMRTVIVSPAQQSTTDFGMIAPSQTASPPPSDESANDNEQPAPTGQPTAPAEDTNPFKPLPTADDASSTTVLDTAA